ncbi:hypothetical protein [Methylocella sp.]|uniref:hypothetical protein n=1 Tax=Methylocella sp. TaxID=1978226 RepID=UPI003784C853
MTLDVDTGVLEVEAAVVEAPAAPTLADLGDVLVNVRFFPDGKVNTIDNCPRNLDKQAWFYALCRLEPFRFHTLAGGRGHYRIPFARFQQILAEVSA